jgi:hypothetical protein
MRAGTVLSIGWHRQTGSRESLVLALISSLPVIEILILWKLFARTEDMNGAGHIFMDQAHLFVISSLRKRYLKDCSFHEEGECSGVLS